MDLDVSPHIKFFGVFQVNLEGKSENIATMNRSPGRKVYGEQLIRKDNIEYRIWSPFRSKLAAAIHRGLENLPIKENSRVLYLGAASGTTASHISDIVGDKGYVFCVEFAHRSIRDLINNVCRFRRNMVPIMYDARFPNSYASIVGNVDVIYCDIAQPEQARILVNNAKIFLNQAGWIMFAVKARSIDVRKNPVQVYIQESEILKKARFNISETILLDPYEKDHAMIVAFRIHS